MRRIAGLVLSAMVGFATAVSAAEWKTISPEQSHILLAEKALAVLRRSDRLLESNNYSGFANLTVARNSQTGTQITLVYRTVHPGFVLAIDPELRSVTKYFSEYRDKSPNFRDLPSRSNHITRFESVGVSLDGRECLLFRQYWGAAPADRYGAGDTGVRSVNELVGQFCPGRSDTLSETVIELVAFSYGIRGQSTPQR